MLLFLLILTSFSQQVSTSVPKCADKKYYLVDSLNLEKLNKNELILLDSCLQKYHNASHDTIKINAINTICQNMIHKSWHKYHFFQYNLINSARAAYSATTIAQSNQDPVINFLNKALASTLNNFGIISHGQGNISLALEYYHKSLEIEQLIGNKIGIALIYTNLGIIHKNRGEIPIALDYCHRGLKIWEEMEDKKGIADAYNSIGVIHKNQGDLELGLNYHRKSLKLRKEIGDTLGLSITYNNIGAVHSSKGNILSALDYYHKSLKLQEKIGDEKGIAMACQNIGNILCGNDSIEEGLVYLYRALELAEKSGDKSEASYAFTAIGKQVFNLRKYKQAKDYGNRGLNLALEIGFPDLISRNAGLLSKVAKQEGNYREALEMYELKIQYSDSLKNKETQKATIRQQTKYEFEKAQLIKVQEEKEQARLVSEELLRRDNLQYSIILICILLVFGGVLGLGFIKVSPRLAEGLIFFAFLILFEFVLVLTDPYVDQWTGGAPGWKLLINAVFAGLIFPAHGFFERMLKNKLMKRSKPKQY